MRVKGCLRGLTRVLTQPWPLVDQGVSLGVVGDVFEVMAQVDRRLTKVNSVDQIIRVNKPDWKPGASQFDKKVSLKISRKISFQLWGGRSMGLWVLFNIWGFWQSFSSKIASGQTVHGSKADGPKLTSKLDRTVCSSGGPAGFVENLEKNQFSTVGRTVHGPLSFI
jgi:hypothetical protein